MSNVHNLPYNAAAVVNILKDLSLESCVIGGYARDLYYGVTPKDVDIAVYQWDLTPNPPIDILAKEISERILGKLRTGVITKFPSGELGGRISCILRISGVDIAFHRNCAFSTDVANKLDCNINQFIVVSGEAIFIGDKHPKDGLVFLRDSVREHRKLKATEKWREIYD